MKKHVEIYLKYFKLGEQDLLTCEACLLQGRVDGSGFDIHHIHGRTTDDITNLMCLCRKHHAQAHSIYDKNTMQTIHNYFLSGARKIFLK